MATVQNVNAYVTSNNGQTATGYMASSVNGMMTYPINIAGSIGGKLNGVMIDLTDYSTISSIRVSGLNPINTYSLDNIIFKDNGTQVGTGIISWYKGGDVVVSFYTFTDTNMGNRTIVIYDSTNSYNFGSGSNPYYNTYFLSSAPYSKGNLPTNHTCPAYLIDTSNASIGNSAQYIYTTTYTTNYRFAYMLELDGGITNNNNYYYPKIYAYKFLTGVNTKGANGISYISKVTLTDVSSNTILGREPSYTGASGTESSANNYTTWSSSFGSIANMSETYNVSVTFNEVGRGEVTFNDIITLTAPGYSQFYYQGLIYDYLGNTISNAMIILKDSDTSSVLYTTYSGVNAGYIIPIPGNVFRGENLQLVASSNGFGSDTYSTTYDNDFTQANSAYVTHNFNLPKLNGAQTSCDLAVYVYDGSTNSFISGASAIVSNATYTNSQTTGLNGQPATLFNVPFGTYTLECSYPGYTDSTQSLVVSQNMTMKIPVIIWLYGSNNGGGSGNPTYNPSAFPTYNPSGQPTYSPTTIANSITPTPSAYPNGSYPNGGNGGNGNYDLWDNILNGLGLPESVHPLVNGLIVVAICACLGAVITVNTPNIYLIGLFAMIGICLDVFMQVWPWWYLVAILIPLLALVAYRFSGADGGSK